MIRALWYMVKVGLLVAAAVWLADRPGIVRIDWLDYTFKIHLGFFLLGVVGVILLAVLIYTFMRFVADLPRRYKSYRYVSDREKGHRALALGLTAVAAGDARSAGKQAKRAIKFLPQDKGMPLLLLAQSARLKGDEAEAQRIFGEMLTNKDTAFLGVRGLLQVALDARDMPRALGLARRGLVSYPQQKWLLRLVYDLEIRNKNWIEAGVVLERAEKSGAIEKDKARSERLAMLMLEADELQKSGMLEQGLKKLKKIYKMDPYFVPGVLALARRYKYDGQRKKGQKLIEKAWEKTAHGALAAAWREFVDTGKGADALKVIKWEQKLLEAHPDSADAHLAVAKAAIDASLWGEARDYLQRAEDIQPDARIFKLRAEIEQRAFHDDSDALIWLKKAENAPQPRCWICRETGRIYEEWSPIALPHGSFNTIDWEFPQMRTIPVLPDVHAAQPDGLLQVPQLFQPRTA